MTGFGKASFESRRAAGTIEIRTVNHRYLKLSLRLPPSLSEFEAQVEATVRNTITRGSVHLNVRLSPESRRSTATFDLEAVAGYLRSLRQIKQRFGLEGEPTLDLVVGLPDVLRVESEDESSSEGDWKGLRAGLGVALDELRTMRETEGAKLARDIVRRRRRIEQLTNRIRRRAPKVVGGYAARLRQRVSNLVGDRQAPLEPADLAREIAFFADRSDVTEELDRLASHLQQFDTVIATGTEAGRRLEFILHEMFREANTIGSKANDAEISHLVVEMKAEIEKIREQVQNIE